MNTEDYLAIARQGAEVWNAWRDENPDDTPELPEVDLAAEMADGAKGYNWREADLRNCRLEGIDASESLYPNGLLFAAKAREADFTRSSMFSAECSRADFQGAKLQRANFRHAFLSEAKLQKADLRGADFHRATLGEIVRYIRRLDNKFNFKAANLAGANLKSARFEYAFCWRCMMRQANLGGIYGQEADFSECNLEFARLNSANLLGANLSNTVIGWATFFGTNLKFVNFLGAQDLNPEQVKVAEDWKLAYYDKPLLEALGLEPKHNSRVLKKHRRWAGNYNVGPRRV